MVELDQGGRLAGKACLEPAPAHLADFVESTFTLHTEAHSDTSWRIVPDVSTHILLHFRADSGGPVLSRASLSGAKVRANDVSVQDRAFSVGARLAPGAFTALTGLPGSVILDRGLELSELWRPEVDRLRDEVGADPRPRAIRAALLNLLTRVGAGRQMPDWRLRGFVRSQRAEPGSGIDAAIAALGVAPRTFRRVCRETIGFGPKRWLRIHRLYRGLGLAIRSPERSGAEVAALAGFTDQPHMIRECRALLGETPVQYFRRAVGIQADSYNDAGSRPAIVA